MTNRTNRMQEIQDRYGNLLDKYVEDVQTNYTTRQDCGGEARNRYGHLVDYMKPDSKIYDDILRLENMCSNVRRQRADAYERENIQRQERIKREKEEEQEHIRKNNAFVESFLEKKKAERKAAEEKRREAEREQDMVHSLQRVINARDEMLEKIARTNTMLQTDKEKRKAHEEKMQWYRKQEMR